MDKELKKDIVKLKKLGLSQPGFKTPENYFEDFSDTLFTKLSEESLPTETGFKVPDTYFENLEETIISNIPISKNKKSKVKILYTISSIAAAFLLYLGLTQYNKSTSTTISFESISANDIQAYIEAGNMNIDSYMIAEIDQQIDFNDPLYNNISDQEINNYLDTQSTEYLFIE